MSKVKPDDDFVETTGQVRFNNKNMRATWLPDGWWGQGRNRTPEAKARTALMLRAFEQNYIMWRRTPVKLRTQTWAEFRAAQADFFGVGVAAISNSVRLIRAREIALKQRMLMGEFGLKHAAKIPVYHERRILVRT